MYKRTIWQDHVDGVQEGTDMSAANFNNLEAGTMEANALAALNTTYRRYDNDIARNSEVVVVEFTFINPDTEYTIAIPETATRNTTDYNIVTEIKRVSYDSVVRRAGDIIIGTKQANGFTAKYNGDSSSVTVRFMISGGMI